MYKIPVYVKIIAILLVLFIIGSVIPPQEVKADAPTAYTFTTFNTTTITAGGAAYSKSLDISAVPADDFLFFTVVADYKHGTPNSAWSSFMNLKLTDGASTTFISNRSASQGALTSESDTTLYWSGILEREYTGGGSLTVQFTDLDTTVGGPYTSSLENVVVTIYPSPTTSTTFTSFNTTTITSGGAAYTQSLDVSHVPPDGYLFFTVVADWVHGTPSSAWSMTMNIQLTNGATTVYCPQSTARQGALDSETDTTLYWSGILDREYTGGGNLTVRFIDTDTTSGGPYTSSLQNVTVSIYPSPTPPKTFDTFTTLEITGGGAASSNVLDVSGLAADDYLYFTVVGDFKGGSNPAWSSTIMMALNNGAGITYFSQSASQGALASVADTTLYWSGVFQRKYTGGGNLTIQFWDTYNDASGPYTSHLENVTVKIYRGAGTGVTAVHLTDLNASTVKDYMPFILVGLVVSVGLIPSIKRRLTRRLASDR